MADDVRFAKTPKGLEEISARRNNLRGKLRTMLILTDPSRSAAALREQGARVGVGPDFIDALVADGYIEPVVLDRRKGGSSPAPPAHVATVEVTDNELAQFRDAKSFMNGTIVSVLGIRAFMFTLRLERCSTRAELGALIGDYENMLRRKSSEAEAHLMAERARGLLG